MAKEKSESIIPAERIAAQIYVIRNESVMLDADLAELYDVETGALVRAMKRNLDRFPEDFAFQLSQGEFDSLRSQTGISSWGGRRYAPYAFTEQGVAMLSGVLRSKRASAVNVAIMRTFVRLRRMLATNEELTRKVAQRLFRGRVNLAPTTPGRQSASRGSVKSLACPRFFRRARVIPHL